MTTLKPRFSYEEINATKMRSYFESIKDLIPDGPLYFNEKGLKLCAMDASHVAVGSLELYASQSDNYTCEGSGHVIVNVGAVTKALKSVTSNDSACICTKPEKKGGLFIAIANSAMDGIQHLTENIDNVDILNVPELEADATVKMSSSLFQRICRENNAINADVLRISVTKDTVKISSSGEMTEGDKDITLRIKKTDNIDEVDDEDDVSSRDGDNKHDEGDSHEDGSKIDHHVKLQTANNDVDLSLNFSMKYLMLFTKATPLSTSVVLKLSVGHPLSVEYLFAKGKVTYLLAPKNEDDE
jgi:proliferating cell nuclear antigen